MTQPDSPTVQPAALRSASPAAVTLLRVYGEDAFSYLQSQVSADLRVAGERWVRYALWLDSRGYVQADTFILRESAESYLLFSYSIPADALEKIVLANVIADDVEVEHLGSGYRHWALWSPTGALTEQLPADALPQAGHFTLVDLQGDCVSVSNGSEGAGSAVLPALLFAGRNTAGENFDLLLPAKAELPPFAAAVSEVAWAEREAQRIGDGVPAIPADIGEGDLPQEGGDLSRIAVSTSKGCYLGQEVIARWHATGQVRSGLFRIQFAGTQAGAGGVTVLPLRLYAGTKPVGELRSFALQTGAGLALLRLHRLGEARELSLEAGGENTFSILGAVAQ